MVSVFYCCSNTSILEYSIFVPEKKRLITDLIKNSQDIDDVHCFYSKQASLEQLVSSKSFIPRALSVIYEPSDDIVTLFLLFRKLY